MSSAHSTPLQYTGSTGTDHDPCRPLFAVIVPLYNAERYLEDTLRAIRAQSFQDFEVVMVDDGSTDGTAQMALHYARADARFHLIRTTNRGIAATRNTAIAHSSAPWIAVCDGDDVWHPHKLEVQAAVLRRWDEPQRGPLAAVGTGGHFINAAGRPVGPIDPPASPWPDAERLDASPELKMINSSVVFRRDLFARAGGYRPEYSPTEDLDLWLRLRALGAVVNVPQRLTEYRMHGQNLSHSSYVPMLLHAERAYVNAQRRAQGLPEWSHDEYMTDLRRTPLDHARRLGALRQMGYYNMAKVNVFNRRYLAAAAALVVAAGLDPLRATRLMRRSRALRRLWSGRAS
ncbi:glycosyltransferase involved in cell wall biosynthesis [Deinococcus metalli]|uniref:Glycosly transferase n=1 Tax=Deinococcus metalli TaxID=1141878 RepID=A0A7W8KF98_9DEIO|nr:glycosyltransferase family A protein [Deinococcus metalli]MBB5375946.1 glycosyltransferase involved in cell wall biosynthesis [Deinococcus metalli]GHF35909.1 glycosly transferase [Deinococcus metalli]